MADPQDFHYMSVLRELEIEAGMLRGGRRESADRKPVSRLMQIFGQAKRRLAQVRVGSGAKISLNLKLSEENQRRAEEEVIANLRRLTEEGEIVGEWPPRVPVSRIVERFTALTIGLRAENPQAEFADCAADAFAKAVIPALAWGLMIRLHEMPADLRDTAQVRLVERLRDAGKPSATDLPLGGETYRKLGLPYLRLVEAWFRLFAEDKPCALPAARRDALRQQLADWFRLPLTELDTRLWQELGELYGPAPAGAARAKAVAQASGGAAFMHERLALFAAAMRPELQDFRLLTEQRPDEAVRRTFIGESPNPPEPESAGLEACGAAFWLARASFGKHAQPHADAASARTLLLLLRAAALLKDKPDRRAVCLRFAAGFATNPRYTRSALVLSAQEGLVELYARTPLARKALIEQFRGRIAWQKWKAGEKAQKARALDHYMKALDLHDRGAQGLDAEGPLHFFPELVVLLGQDTNQGKRAEADLRTVDFITQRNHGIYFDIEKEARLIEAGLREYKALQAAAAEARSKPADEAEETAEEESAEAEDQTDALGLPMAFSSLIKRSDDRKYRALLRALWNK